MINKQVQIIALLGALLCLLAVAIGAFGAHAFKDILVANQKAGVYDLANRYQFYHGLALLLIAALFNRSDVKPNLKALAVLMFIGTLIFSGSLYLLALLNITWLGAVTPIGGILLLIAWLLLLLQIIKAGSLSSTT
ncbi:MAG: uncharacterized membrane protein YgdD (TMEM256/DUF423 family) [Arenicella sp.]|jgi:uncharacterized membrane protein YgdD (TMEM256/DUF423 family)